MRIARNSSVPPAGAPRGSASTAKLVDVIARRSVPARELLEDMLTFLRPALEGQGDWDEVSELVRKMLDHGNSAKRQLWAFAQSGRLEDVIDLILRETSQGL